MTWYSWRLCDIVDDYITSSSSHNVVMETMWYSRWLYHIDDVMETMWYIVDDYIISSSSHKVAMETMRYSRGCHIVADYMTSSSLWRYDGDDDI